MKKVILIIIGSIITIVLLFVFIIEFREVRGSKFEPIIENKQKLIVLKRLIFTPIYGDLVIFKTDTASRHDLGVIAAKSSNNYIIISKLFDEEHVDLLPAYVVLERDVHTVNNKLVIGKVIYPKYDTELILDNYDALRIQAND